MTEALSRFVYRHRKGGLRPLLSLENAGVCGVGLLVTGRNLCSAVCTNTSRKRVRRSLVLASLYEITRYNVEKCRLL